MTLALSLCLGEGGIFVSYSYMLRTSVDEISRGLRYASKYWQEEVDRDNAKRLVVDPTVEAG